jgi:myo-inositol 2-dehydrogenase/D-chiro-inositol 1-dehydrogenase
MNTLDIAMIGVGRIGFYHARHLQELAAQRQDCRLVAVVDTYQDAAAQVTAKLQCHQDTPIRAFTSVADLVASGISAAAVIASRTQDHGDDARQLIDAGHRVLLEKPLTGTLAAARALVVYLQANERRQQALMLGFMRRFDAPLLAAKSLVDEGIVGEIFKIVSILEDPLPPPDGYNSPGLLTDMSVHNIDEICWLLGALPDRVAAFGALLYNQKITTVKEDLDDAFLQMSFCGDRLGQIQVSRNHVAGYRNETWVYGPEGGIHVGHFSGDPLTVELEVFRKKGVTDRRRFTLRPYEENVPVFIQRFGEAYKAEAEAFIDACLTGAPFSVGPMEGLRAQEIASAGNAVLVRSNEGAGVEYG